VRIAGLGPEYAAQFDDPSVVDAYDSRPPYPEPLVDWILSASGTVSPRLVELGCGTGELARRLAPRASHVTAIDRSSRMIARAGSCPGGDAPNIAWLTGDVADTPIAGSFDLAVAAESFHCSTGRARANGCGRWCRLERSS
jgi:predicted TPR repeat methyltransferase